MTTVNRNELARRIAAQGGYAVGDIEEVLKLEDDLIVEALQNGENIKRGKLYKIVLQLVPEKLAWNGFEKKHFIRKAKRVPKFKLLSRLNDIELPVEEDEKS